MKPDDNSEALAEYIKSRLQDLIDHGGAERARDIYDWLAAELNKHDAETGNFHYLTARERIHAESS